MIHQLKTDRGEWYFGRNQHPHPNGERLWFAGLTDGKKYLQVWTNTDLKLLFKALRWYAF